MTRALAVLLVAWCCAAHRSADDDLLDARIRRELAGPAPVRGALYCTGGATLRQDGLSVWCQR